MNNRVKVAWVKRREVSGVTCGKKIKDKIYKTIVKTAMPYGLNAGS